nr:ABC transporter permease [Anaerolineae bacterium]
MRWFFNALRRTWSIAKKEFVHIWMDPGALFLVVAAPAVLLTLLAYIFTFDAGDSDIAVVDMDQTPQSSEYVRWLTADGHITVTASPRSYDEAVRLLENGRVNSALVIPPGFGAALSGGGLAYVHNIVDGVDAGAARQVMGAVETRTHLFAAEMGVGGAPPIDVRARVWFNENLSSQHSMVPGLMALVLILPGMAVALGVTREKETGTLEQLVTTPVLGSDVLLGKIFVYVSLGVLSALIALGVSRLWFGVPFRGSLLLYILATAAYLLACMGFSLIVAHFARSQQTAMVIILLMLFMPGFLMSGLSDPVDPSNFGSWLFAQFLPTTHYIYISRAIALKGLPITAYLFDYGVLLVMGILSVAVAVTLFEKKLG